MMSKSRLEAFSDGVLAILITIMVLDLKVPRGDTVAALEPILPVFLGYVLSFIYLGIYWNNHHHMLQTVRRVNGAVLWANLHLLFWLSLLPFATGWMGSNHFAATPSALYGLVLLGAALAYWLLQHAIIHADGDQSLLRRAIGRDGKGTASLLLYVVAIGLTFWSAAIAQLLYTLVALLWFIPDRRIECTIAREEAIARATAAEPISDRS